MLEPAALRGLVFPNRHSARDEFQSEYRPILALATRWEDRYFGHLMHREVILTIQRSGDTNLGMVRKSSHEVK
jgi:hypothetical protein